MARRLPSGRVTFAFVDVVESTKTFAEHGEAFVAALAVLQERIARHAHAVGGVVVKTEGDGAFLAFSSAGSAAEALVGLQSELAQAPASEAPRLDVRAGAHTGDAVPIADDYVALAVNVAARVTSAAGAGQVLVSAAVAEALAGEGVVELAGEPLGEFALKDVGGPTRLHRVAGDAEPPRAPPYRRTNVAEPVTTFVGRDRELADLRQAVASHRLVSVVGPGGMGKTRLTSQLLLEVASTYEAGAWLVELASITRPDQVNAQVAAAVGSRAGTIDDLATELGSRGRMLLVLDSCEHLIDTVAEVADRLLAKCRQLTVLCTSLEPLQLPGERVWRLSALSPSDAAVTLFLDRLGPAVDRELDLDLVGKLCAALDGLPLAIELAAGHAHSAHLDELIDAVTSGSDALRRRGGEARQQSLDAILDWSLARLSAPLLHSLLVLSVFPGRFSPAMAHSVLRSVPSCDPSAARALGARSLVDLDGTDYRMLATIRAAARRRCVADPLLQQQAYDALMEWTAEYGAERYDVLTYQEDVPPDTLLAVEAGLVRGVESGRTGLGKAWHLMSQCVNVRGAGSTMAHTAQAALQRNYAHLDADALLTLAAALIITSLTGGHASLSTAQAEAMVAAARATKNPVLLERTLDALAAGDAVQGESKAALAHSLAALRVVEQHQEVRHRLPAALNNVGACLARLGDTTHARPYYERAIEAAEQVGNFVSLSIAHGNLAEMALLDGRPLETVHHALAAVRSAPPEWRLRGYTLGHLSRAHAALGDPEAAAAAAREALPLLRSMAKSDPNGQGEIDLLLAAVPELGS